MAEEWLKVGKHVVLLILDIFVKVQSCAVGHIRVFELEADLIFLRAAQLRFWEPNSVLLKLKTTGRLSIYNHVRNFLALEI